MKLCLRCNQYFADGMAACPRDSSILESVGKDPLIGALINDRYVVDSVIGKGSSGIVYKATRLMMGREVAVKVLHSFLGADSGSLDRVLREFAAASKLRHPHIITLWEHGITDDQQPYLVMDYLEGGTLADLIKERKYLHPSRALPIVEQVCDALSEAHSQEIVHRDIKPENIVLEEMGDGDDYVNDYVKVLDFGIADVPEAKSSQVGRPKTVAGSPAYMSPEQCQGMPLDARSDIYSMAVMVFEMLTGERPFQHEEHRALMLAHVTEPPIKLGAVRSDLQFPEELENVIAKALSKKPDTRYADINEFWRALKDACRGIKSPPPSSARPAKKVDSVKVDAFEFMPEERLTSGESIGQVIPWGDDIAPPPMPPPMPAQTSFTNEAARALAADIEGDLWALEPHRDDTPATPAPLDPEKWLKQSRGEDITTNGESSFESGWGEDPALFQPGKPPPPPPPGYQPLPGIGITPSISPSISSPPKPSTPSYASSAPAAQAQVSSTPPPPAPPKPAPAIQAAAPQTTPPQTTPPLPNQAAQIRRPLVQPPSKGGPAVPAVPKPTAETPAQTPTAQSGQPLAQAAAIAPKPIGPAQSPASGPPSGQPSVQNRPGLPVQPGTPQAQRIGAAPSPLQPGQPAAQGLPQGQKIGGPPQSPRIQTPGVPAQSAPQVVPGPGNPQPQAAPPVPPGGKPNEISDALNRINSALELKFGDLDDDEDEEKAALAKKAEAAKSAPASPAPVKAAPQDFDRKRADRTLIEPIITEDELLTRAPQDLADIPAPLPPPPPPPPPPPTTAPAQGTPARPAPPPPAPPKPLDETLKERTLAANANPPAPMPEVAKKRPDQTIVEMPPISEDDLLTRAPKDIADEPQPMKPPAPPPPPPPPPAPAPPQRPAEEKRPAAETKIPPRGPDPMRPKRPDQTLIEAAISEDQLLTRVPEDVADKSPVKNQGPAQPQAKQPEQPAKAPLAESKIPPKDPDPLRPKRHDQTLIEAAIDESELLTRTAKDVADEKIESGQSPADSSDFISGYVPPSASKEPIKGPLPSGSALEEPSEFGKSSQSISDRLAQAAGKQGFSAKSALSEKESQSETAALPEADNSAVSARALFNPSLSADQSEAKTQTDKNDLPSQKPPQPDLSSAAQRLFQAGMSAEKDKMPPPAQQSKTGLGALMAAKNAPRLPDQASAPKPPEKPVANPLESKTGMQSMGPAAKLSQTDLPSTETAAKAAQPEPAPETMEPPTQPTPPADNPDKKPSTGLGNLLSAKLAQVEAPKEESEKAKPSPGPVSQVSQSASSLAAAKPGDSMPGMQPAKPQAANPMESQSNLSAAQPAEKPKAKSSGYFSAIQSRTNMPAQMPPETRPDPPKKSRTDLPQQSFESAAAASFTSPKADFNASTGFNSESDFKGGGAQDRLAAAKGMASGAQSAQPAQADPASGSPLGDEKFSSAVSRLMDAAKRKEQEASSKSGSFSSGAAAALSSGSLPHGGIPSGAVPSAPELGSAASRLAAASGDANDTLTSDLMNRFLEAANRGSELKKKASDANVARGEAINREMAQPSSAGPSMENMPQIDIAEQTQERLRMAMESTGKHAARPAPPKMPDLSSMRPSDLQLHTLTQMRGSDMELNLDAPGSKKDSQTRTRMRSAFKNQGIDIRWVVLGLVALIACGAGYWFILKPILDKPPAVTETGPSPAQQSFTAGKFSKTIEVLEKKEKKNPLTDEEEDLLQNARYKQAEILVKSKRFAEAKKLLKKIPDDSVLQAKVKELQKKYRKLRK